VIAMLSVLTWRQIEHWKNSETLFRHAALVTRDNWLAYNHLASAMEGQMRFPEALDAAGHALELHPSAITHFNYGNVLLKMGRLDEAAQHYQRAVALAPDNPQMRVARNNWAIALAQLNQAPQAESLLRETMKLYPDYADAHANLGTVLLLEKRFDEAAAEYRAALRLDPRHEKARRGLERLGIPAPPLPH
jgi:tetratricopeptide (TPR) repeat protein